MTKYLLMLLLFSLPYVVYSQPAFNDLYHLEQRDSLYYLISNNVLYKFYSQEASGEFFLTKYVEGKFRSNVKIILNDDHLFVFLPSYYPIYDTILYYSNTNPWELSYENKFIPEYPVNSVHGFGPYFIIRSSNTYHLYKILNGSVILVEDSLFNHPGQYLVFMTYPYITAGNTVYKYAEGSGLSVCGQIDIGNVNHSLSGNTIISYYCTYPVQPGPLRSRLKKTSIEEPQFPQYIYDNFGMGINQLLLPNGTGIFIAKKHLYYMKWVQVITTDLGGLAYLPAENDKAIITDYYIFLLESDSIKYSRWNAGTVFYPFTWSTQTSIEKNQEDNRSFELYQNYPNPFNPVTKIRYTVPQSSQVLIRIFDILSNEVETLVNKEQSKGSYEIIWNAAELPSGIYFCRLTSGEFTSTKKLLLMK